MKTHIPSKGEIVRQWHVVDAGGQVLGRVASKAAMILMGKHKPTYTPFLDTGDHVIVINAAKVRLTGAKEDQKIYRRHTRLSGRAHGNRRGENARHASDENDRASDRGHAPEDQTRQADVPEVEGIRRRQASAPGAEAGGSRNIVSASNVPPAAVIFPTDKQARKVTSGRISPVFGNGPPEDVGRAHVPATGQRHDHGQRPGHRSLFCERSLARHRAPAAAGHGDGGQVRRHRFSPTAAAPTGQAGAARLGIARALIEFNSELRPQAEAARLADPRPARARAQEVRPEGRAQAVPVLETLTVRQRQCTTPFAFRPAHTNSALGRVRPTADRAKPATQVSTRRHFAINFHEGIARSGRSLRAPDQALESKDEGIHLWRTQRDLHHRSPEDPEAVQGRHALCGRDGRARQDGAVRRNQAPGAGSHRRRSHALQQYYVNQRWLGGLLTNMPTVQKSIKRLKELDAMASEGSG